MNQSIINVIIGAAILGLIVFRVSRERKFPIGSLWVFPAILVALGIVDIVLTGVSSPLDILYMLIAFAAGGAFGWYQGIHSTVRVDKKARAAFVKSSPIGIALFVAALAFRMGARYMSGSFSSSAYSGDHLSPAVALTSAITLIFAVGLITGLRYYVKQKYDESPA
jgi:energy-converting hydrogenase Eha subunit A